MKSKTIPGRSALFLAFTLILMSATSYTVLACDDDAKPTQSSTSKEPSLSLTEAGPHQAVFQVNGIMCKSCEKKIQAALQGVPGVKSVTFVKAGLKDKSGLKEGIRLAQVTFDKGSQVAPEILKQAVAGAGYKAILTQ